jgi:hypothetical protein
MMLHVPTPAASAVLRSIRELGRRCLGLWGLLYGTACASVLPFSGRASVLPCGVRGYVLLRPWLCTALKWPWLNGDGTFLPAI